MYIADILNNLPKENTNSLTAKISKNAEVRRIKGRLENYVSQVLDFLGEENAYINRGLTYSSNPADCKLSEQDKKELTDLLVSEVKSFPDKLKAEINKFFEGVDTSSKEDKENKTTGVELTLTKAVEPKEGSVFGY